jgi:hypothetical protein
LVAFSGAPFGFSAPPQGSVNVGYLVADAAQGPNASLHFSGVELTGVTTARIALSSWYDINDGTPSQFSLRYRLNGGTWIDRPLTAAELALTMASPAGPQIVEGVSPFASQMWGAFGQMLEVPLADLVAGDNTVEFVTANVPQSYPPAVANVDLILGMP